MMVTHKTVIFCGWLTNDEHAIAQLTDFQADRAQTGHQPVAATFGQEFYHASWVHMSAAWAVTEDYITEAFRAYNASYCL